MPSLGGKGHFQDCWYKATTKHPPSCTQWCVHFSCIPSHKSQLKPRGTLQTVCFSAVTCFVWLQLSISRAHKNRCKRWMHSPNPGSALALPKLIVIDNPTHSSQVQAVIFQHFLSYNDKVLCINSFHYSPLLRICTVLVITIIFPQQVEYTILLKAVWDTPASFRSFAEVWLL